LLESERPRMPIIYHDSNAESDHYNDNIDDYHYDDNSSETEYSSYHGSNHSTDSNSNHSNLSINGGVYSILVVT